MRDIIAKWKSGEVFVTADGRYFLEDGTQLHKEYKSGICFRARGRSKRYYYRKLNKNKKIVHKVIKQYTPF